jgi:hypothetical protein
VEVEQHLPTVQLSLATAFVPNTESQSKHNSKCRRSPAQKLQIMVQARACHMKNTRSNTCSVSFTFASISPQLLRRVYPARYHRAFLATPILVLLTLSANFRLVIVSARHFLSGATMTNISVLLFPPREYCKRYVNLLFR